jgi:hypothetical protein
MHMKIHKFISELPYTFIKVEPSLNISFKIRGMGAPHFEYTLDNN